MRKRNRILAAALGLVATTGALGTFGALETFENRALFGDETTTSRPIGVKTKEGELAAPSGRKAFLVAADNYGSRAAALPGAKNDVEALAERLEELGFDVVVLKTNDDYENLPQKSVIEAEFDKFVSQLRKGDFALVFLSGHGIQKTSTGEAFLAPIDVKTESVERLFETSVSIRDMMAKLEKSAATFRWTIVDACREDPTQTGSASAFATAATARSFAGAAKSLGQVSDVPQGLALLQSCQPNKFSYEGPVGADGKRRGFFATSLLEAFDRQNPKADANGDGALSFYELTEYVSRRTNELAEAHDKEQKPNLTGSITNFALLTDLLKDGLPLSKWNEADALYQEACVFRVQKKWRDALTKIKKAREINKVRDEYRTAEAEIQAQVDATVASETRAEADKAAEDAWTAFNKGGVANVKEAVAQMKRSLELVASASNRNALALFEAKLKELQTPKPETPPTVTPPRPKPDPEPSTQTQGQAQTGGSTSGRTSTSGTGTTSTSSQRPTSTTQTSTQTGGSSSGRTSTPGASANGGWSGEYAAGTAKTLTIKGLEYKFHYCPAGSFTMGSPESERAGLSYADDEGPQRRVELTNGFWMLETEVTQAMWKSVTGENPSWFSSSGRGASDVSGLDTSQFPVEDVSWNDCQEFIEKLNSGGYAPSGFKFRLPTEAEWEYACRAGTTGPYAGSSLDSLGWYGGNSGYRTQEVGTKSANAWGLRDMHGNVWEWCEDLYADYKYLNGENPINVTVGSLRVLRGGGWGDGAKNCRSAERGHTDPTHRYNNFGFRLALVRSSSSSK